MLRLLRALLSALLPPPRRPEIRYYLFNPEEAAVGRYIVDTPTECDGCGTARVRATHRFILNVKQDLTHLDLCDHHTRKHDGRLRDLGWMKYELRVLGEE